MAKFKTVAANYFVTFTISFLFMYLYFLIIGLDDPFNSTGDTEVDLKLIDCFLVQLKEGFLIS